MSLKVLEWAWTVPLPSTPKLVLVALAYDADDTGYCFPSQARLARECSVSDRTIRRMIVLLVVLGHVVVEQRFNRKGGRTSNGYRLLWKAPWANVPGVADTAVHGALAELSGGIGQRCPGAPDTAVHITTTDLCSYLKNTTTARAAPRGRNGRNVGCALS